MTLKLVSPSFSKSSEIGRTATYSERNGRARGEDDRGRTHASSEDGENRHQAMITGLDELGDEQLGIVDEFDVDRSQHDCRSELCCVRGRRRKKGRVRTGPIWRQVRGTRQVPHDFRQPREVRSASRMKIRDLQLIRCIIGANAEGQTKSARVRW